MATDKTITATLSTTQSRLEEVADNRGYNQFVYEEQDVTNEDGEVVDTQRVKVDNPQSKIDFVKDEIKDVLSREITKDKKREIRQQKRQEEQQEIEELEENAKEDLDVKIE